jgi:hypothetical protein
MSSINSPSETENKPDLNIATSSPATNGAPCVETNLKAETKVQEHKGVKRKSPDTDSDSLNQIRYASYI